MRGILFWWSLWQDKYGKMLGELRESVMGTEAGQGKREAGNMVGHH